ncbi:unnamed protein product [Pleuronectes platessa]|uniref:Uncharacterized protein n=1 Tax=Pleuronectes platessa TaxID=8262 RepID=A0A9N7YFD0_PLEPL|nr:unnamed protein product [Pleuronectes platessa]
MELRGTVHISLTERREEEESETNGRENQRRQTDQKANDTITEQERETPEITSVGVKMRSSVWVQGRVTASHRLKILRHDELIFMDGNTLRGFSMLHDDDLPWNLRAARCRVHHRHRNLKQSDLLTQLQICTRQAADGSRSLSGRANELQMLFCLIKLGLRSPPHADND